MKGEITERSVSERDEPEKKYTHCANCGAELEDEYFFYADNFLQINYFEEVDGSDNAFCSEACALECLMLTAAENTHEGRV
jgi:hypothetical protein